MAIKSGVMNKLYLLFLSIAIIFSSTPAHSQEIWKEVMIPMSDGVNLAANITLPDTKEKYPVILVRTPYNKENGEDDTGVYWAENGFVFMIQDCRGTGKSEGEWYPAIYEKNDGIDTRSWILEQPWCNGNIGTTGGSYLGFTQFVSSTESNNSLKAMFPIIPLMDWYEGATYINGALNLGTVMGWGLEMANPSKGEGSLIDEETWDWEQVYRTLPLIDFDKNVSTELTWMRDWIKNPEYNDYWGRYHIADIKENCNTPLITVSGWYDIFMSQAFDYHADAIDRSKSNQHLIVGPWGHGPNYIPGERELNENHELDFESLELRWFNIWLKGQKDNIDLPPLKLYVMGKNYWRDENEWPLARTQYMKYYFDSNGKANSLQGDGFLSTQTPTGGPTDHFIYDPENPVPTKGGAILFEEPGVYDQRNIEKRNDVLVYTNPVLKENLEVTGHIKVILFASTDSRDTDWTAKLVDVYPDGSAFNLCDGIIRAQYHKDPLNPKLVTPDQIYRYEIDLWATSNVFLSGHKIRVEISSSNFPRFDRNPNTGNTFGMDAKIKKAKQKVYHSVEYPSHIILPVIPSPD
jgi:putative CocE/NonD family hydrolase